MSQPLSGLERNGELAVGSRPQRARGDNGVGIKRAVDVRERRCGPGHVVVADLGPHPLRVDDLRMLDDLVRASLVLASVAHATGDYERRDHFVELEEEVLEVVGLAEYDARGPSTPLGRRRSERMATEGILT